MGLKQVFSRYEENFPWRILGVVIAISSFTYGIYMGFFYEKKAEIKCEIINDVNVLDIKEQIKELEILFREENINKSNLDLKMVSIKISNTGRIDIVNNLYDESMPFGFNIQNGNIVEANLLHASSDYLNSKANPIVINPHQISFDRFIFEKGNYYLIKILLLHEKNSIPTISPTGKIAGINKIQISKSDRLDQKTSFLMEAFGGKGDIQFARIIGYSMLVASSLLTLFSFLSYISTNLPRTFQKRRRKKLIVKFSSGKDVADYDDFFYSYLQYGEDYLREIFKLVKNPNDFQDYVKSDTPTYIFSGECESLSGHLLKNIQHLLIKEKGLIQFKQEFKDLYYDFIAFLKKEGIPITFGERHIN